MSDTKITLVQWFKRFMFYFFLENIAPGQKENI